MAHHIPGDGQKRTPSWVDDVLTDPDNVRRADWASLALATHYKATHPVDEFPESTEDPDDKDEVQLALQDLLCDLRHFALQSGLDYLLADENASEHYCTELEEEDENRPLP
jgi:maltooligosyltrehalose synthase